MAEIKKNGFELLWQTRNLFIHPDIDRELASCTFKVKSWVNLEWIASIRNEGLKLMATLWMKDQTNFSGRVRLKFNAFVLLMGKIAFPVSEENFVDSVLIAGNPDGLKIKIHEDCSVLFPPRNGGFYCDSLTVCCQLNLRDLSLHHPLIYFALSNNNQICERFTLSVNNFSSFVQDHKFMQSHFSNLSVTIYYDMSLGITLIDDSKKNLVLLDSVLLMDVHGMATKVWDRSLSLSKGTTLDLGTSIKSQLKDKSIVLNDRLTLQFQISTISPPEAALLVGEDAGKTSDQYQGYVNEFFEQYETKTNQPLPTKVTIQHNAPHSLNTDMQNLLSEGTLTDFELRFPGNSIHAHKAVLCARSSVFKAMISTDMKESANNRVDIEDDLDAATMQHLVNFMYSDSVPSLDWDSTVKLYQAADKYDVPQLKQGCSKFLSSYVSVGNVCSLLCLADKHADRELKRVAHSFLFKHDEAIIYSQEWNLLVKADSKLAYETMTSLYQITRMLRK